MKNNTYNYNVTYTHEQVMAMEEEFKRSVKTLPHYVKQLEERKDKYGFDTVNAAYYYIYHYYGERLKRRELTVDDVKPADLYKAARKWIEENVKDEESTEKEIAEAHYIWGLSFEHNFTDED